MANGFFTSFFEQATRNLEQTTPNLVDSLIEQRRTNRERREETEASKLAIRMQNENLGFEPNTSDLLIEQISDERGFISKETANIALERLKDLRADVDLQKSKDIFSQQLSQNLSQERQAELESTLSQIQSRDVFDDFVKSSEKQLALDPDIQFDRLISARQTAEERGISPEGIGISAEGKLSVKPEIDVESKKIENELKRRKLGSLEEFDREISETQEPIERTTLQPETKKKADTRNPEVLAGNVVNTDDRRVFERSGIPENEWEDYNLVPLRAKVGGSVVFDREPQLKPVVSESTVKVLSNYASAARGVSSSIDDLLNEEFDLGLSNPRNWKGSKGVIANRLSNATIEEQAKLEAFKAKSDALFQSYRQAVTGAQAGFKELSFLATIFPSANDPAEIYVQKAIEVIDNANRNMNTILDFETASGRRTSKLRKTVNDSFTLERGKVGPAIDPIKNVRFDGVETKFGKFNIGQVLGANGRKFVVTDFTDQGEPILEERGN